MRPLLLTAALLTAAPGTEGFDGFKPGAPPATWECGVTGQGSPVWRVEADATAPSPPNVLKQSGSGDFPWCVLKASALADGFVEVQVKPLSGQEDQAGGVVFRWKGPGDYYIARANALEDNVALFRTQNGERRLVKNVGLKVASGAWHRVRVEFTGTRFTIFFDGKRVLDVEDDKITGSGAAGVWTKADSVTAFDSFAFGPVQKR